MKSNCSPIKLLLVALLICTPVASVNAGAILSNLPGISGGTSVSTNLGLGPDLFDRSKAVGLTMDAVAMTFVSLEALISNETPDSILSGGIYTDVGGNPGALVAAFTPVNVASNFGPSIVTLTTAASSVLAANTSYWFLLDGPGTENLLLWDSLAPNTAPTATGVAYDGYRFSSDGGTSWAVSGIFNGVRINATAAAAVPAPATLALLGLGLAGIGWSRRKAA
ncbi:MAG: PEP-CTERM sorting domain-containing protein [Pseudomonadales bacterium]|nr:PEP-CTERM sorting domain-containing protein [Pseudomonadales bacterium]